MIGINKAATPEHDEIDFSAILYQLIANKWLLIGVTLAALAIGFLIARSKVPEYQSDVLLQIDSGRPEMGQGSFASQFALSSGAGAGNSVVTQIALIQSRFILDPVIQALGLDITVQPKNQPFWKRLFYSDPGKNMVEIQSFDVPKQQLNEPFQLRVDKPGHVILLDSKGKLVLQGFIGHVLTNANQTIRLRINIVDAPVGANFKLMRQTKLRVERSLMNKLKIEEVGSKTQRGTGILSMTYRGEDPEQVIRVLNTIAQVARDQDAKKKSREASQTLSFLYQQLPITKGELEKSESSLNRYRAKSGKIDIKMQTQFLLNQLSELDKKLGELNINKIDMLQHYMPIHPAYVALNTQIKALEAQRHRLEKRLKSLPASDQIAVNLLRDVNVKKTLYIILLNKIQELQVVKAGTISGLRILAKAKIPDAPLPIGLKVIYLSSMLLGFLFCALIIFGRKLLYPRVEDPHWGERQFNLTNLAIVPYCKEQAIAAEGCDRSKQMPLLALTNPRNFTIESLRSLRTSLQVSLLGASNNIVSILGVSPAVGKSFVTANLAYLLASAGKRVLMIDADLRRGTLHKYVNIPPSPGLADVLNKTVSIEQALIGTVNEQLVCLPRGSYPDDPSELLTSPYFKDLIQTLSQQFDVIVIDTAPVLLVTDAVLVGGLSGTNYIVFGAGAHQPSEIEMALKRLHGSGVQVHGSIFNFHRSQSKKMGYGQYGNYSYYYDESMTVKS